MKFGNFISLTHYCINKSQKLNLNYSFGDCSRAAAASRVEHFVMVVNGWCGIEALPIYVPGFRFLVCGSGGWGLGQGGGGAGVMTGERREYGIS